MPLYEYACKACGQHLEVAQSFKDDPLTTCPSCEGPLRKVFGSIGISFKGTGFYRTDSRMAAKRESSAAGDGAKTKETAKAEGASEGKAEGKSDAKSEAKEAASAKESSGSKADSGGGAKAADKPSPAPSKSNAKTA